MPAPAIPRTIGDFIFYYYAKVVIAAAAGHAKNYRFIMDQYKRLKSGQAQISTFDREIERLAQRSGICAFCNEFGETVPMAVGQDEPKST